MVIAKIHNEYKNLTATEQKVASFILNNPQSAIHMTAKQVADACGTVPSAVNRTCKSIGVEGFSSLKISLATSLGNNENNFGSTAFNKDDSVEEVFGKVFRSGINTLQNTYKMFDFSKVETIAHKIKDAQRVFIFGVGTSAVIAQDAAYRFSQLGVHAYAYTDILQMSVMAKNMNRGDVAFAVSHSGKTKVVIDAMNFAKESGATTVALTSFEKSPLYIDSDYSLSVYADEENYPVEAVSARIAHMCTVDALMMAIASLNFEAYSEHISLRNQAFDKIRY